MAKNPETNSIIDMFVRIGRDMRMPDVDIERIIEHHRRNLEAFEKSAKAASAGATTLMTRQREMLEETIRDFVDTAQTMGTPSDPKAFMEKQTDLARKGFETAVKNTGEVAELVRQSSTDAIEILRARIRESMAEIREGYDRRDKS
jgi:phasin family protein